MLSQSVLSAMNTQIKHETYSAYLYLSMAAYAEKNNLPGFGKWMRVQAREELAHALKFFDFIYDRGGAVTLLAIEQPPSEFAGATDLFAKSLEHEKLVTGLINDIYALAVKENDYATQVFLHWFIDEQVEEERNASQILETLKMLGESKQGLIMLDHELGHRG